MNETRGTTRNIVVSLLALLVATTAETAPKQQVKELPQIPVLNWTQRSDWVSVKDHGAIGDGKHDDTAAIQKALDGVVNGSVVYFPPGDYLIIKTVQLNCSEQFMKEPRRLIGASVIGHGRASRLIWGGEEDGTMYRDCGVAHSRHGIGLELDGRNKAAVGFHHWNGHQSGFETEGVHQNMAFKNMKQYGILVDPDQKVATAEMLIENCLFENCGTGISFTKFNDYNYTFEGCEFRDCGTGIRCSHGNFYVYNTHFSGSRVVDVSAAPEHGCSLRRVTSFNSSKFIDFNNSVSPLTLENCVVENRQATGEMVSIDAPSTLVFDCVFDCPEDITPVASNAKPLVGSGNVVEGGKRGILDNKLYEIPGGKRKGALKDARRSFLRTEVEVPGKVFDVKVDFGAKGDGSADDTEAIQEAIDAAREHGKGAIAYLPTGRYVISKALNITGKDYYVGGTGFSTILLWRGGKDGVMVHVHDPVNVALENISIGGYSGGVPGLIDILQTSSGKEKTSMSYFYVLGYGMYRKEPFVQGVVFRDLGPKDTVLIEHVQGNLRFMNSAKATILAKSSYEGSVTVEGPPSKDGFLGFQTRLATIVTHGLYLKDNNNIVMSDFYVEQSQNGLVFEGGSEGSGRATISGAKLHFYSAKEGEEETMAIRSKGYNGQILFCQDQFYVEPKITTIEIEGETTLFILGNTFYLTRLNLGKKSGAQVYFANNKHIAGWDKEADAPLTSPGSATGDNVTPGILARMSPHLDDFRRLGEVDLRLKYGSGQ